MKVESAVLFLMFSSCSCFLLFFSVWIQIHSGKDPSGLRSLWFIRPQNCFCTNLKPEAGYQITSAQTRTARPGWASKACQMRPDLLISCLVLSTGRDSIFDQLSSGNWELGVTAGYILTWAEVNNESGVCRVFFLWYSLFLLTWEGISGEASIVLQISSNVWYLWLHCAKHSHTG